MRNFYKFLIPAALGFSAGPVFAQQPCFTADQCAAIRVNNQRLIEQQQAAQAAAEATRIRAQHEAAREAKRLDAEHAQQAQIAAQQAQAEAVERARQLAEQQAAYDERQSLAKIETDRRIAAYQEQQRQDRIEVEQRRAAERATFEEQQRQARIEEERRAAAQLAAEQSPDNHCHEQTTAGSLIDFFNNLQSAADYNMRAVDIDHLTTVRFVDSKTMACHGSFYSAKWQRHNRNHDYSAECGRATTD